MTDHTRSCAHLSFVPQVLPTAPARGAAVRRAPAAAAGVLTAVALGAGVLLLPVAPVAADGLVTATAVQRVAHPTPPEASPEVQAEAPAQPVAAPVMRDPFEPLVRDPDTGASTPAQSPTVSAPPDTTTVVDGTAPAQAPQVQAPTVPPDAGAVSGRLRSLALVSVEAAGDSLVAVLTLDGARVRAEVGDSFGPRADLLLLSLQEGPGDGQWTAVVQVGQGEPFDVVTGAPTRVP